MCLCFHVCGMSINCRPHILTTLQSKSLHEPKSLNLVRQLALGDPCFRLPSTGIGSEVSIPTLTLWSIQLVLGIPTWTLKFYQKVLCPLSSSLTLHLFTRRKEGETVRARNMHMGASYLFFVFIDGRAIAGSGDQRTTGRGNFLHLVHLRD